MTLAKTCHARNVMQDLAKVTDSLIGLLRPEKCFELRCFKCSIFILKEKLNLILKLKVVKLNKKSHICWILLCCKFCQLHFCLILFKLVFISYSFH